MKTKWLIYSGYIVPIVFWSTLLICGCFFENYNHLTHQVSELGALGTPTQYFFTTGLVLGSIFSILFIYGMIKICRQTGLSIIPVLLIITFSFSIFGAAIYPMPLELHGILGSPSAFLFLSPLASLLLWKTDIIPNIKIFSFISLVILLLGFLILAPNILNDYFGIKQRIFHLGWTVWFIYLSSTFSILNKKLT